MPETNIWDFATQLTKEYSASTAAGATNHDASRKSPTNSVQNAAQPKINGSSFPAELRKKCLPSKSVVLKPKENTDKSSTNSAQKSANEDLPLNNTSSDASTSSTPISGTDKLPNGGPPNTSTDEQLKQVDKKPCFTIVNSDDNSPIIILDDDDDDGAASSDVNKSADNDSDNDAVMFVHADVADLESKFDWMVLDGGKIPCIYRDSVPYVSRDMANTQFLSKFVKDEHFNTTHPQCFEMTAAEATLLNDINVKHCNGEYGSPRYNAGNNIVRFLDFKEFFFLRKNVLRRLDTKGGWVQINQTYSPFVIRNGSSYVPLPVIRQAAKLLSQKDKVETVKVTDEELLFLNEECATVHPFGPSIKLVDIDIVKSLPKCERIKVLDSNPFQGESGAARAVVPPKHVKQEDSVPKHAPSDLPSVKNSNPSPPEPPPLLSSTSIVDSVSPCPSTSVQPDADTCQLPTPPTQHIVQKEPVCLPSTQPSQAMSSPVSTQHVPSAHQVSNLPQKVLQELNHIGATNAGKRNASLHNHLMVVVNEAYKLGYEKAVQQLPVATYDASCPRPLDLSTGSTSSSLPQVSPISPAGDVVNASQPHPARNASAQAVAARIQYQADFAASYANSMIEQSSPIVNGNQAHTGSELRRQEIQRRVYDGSQAHTDSELRRQEIQRRIHTRQLRKHSAPYPVGGPYQSFQHPNSASHTPEPLSQPSHVPSLQSQLQGQHVTHNQVPAQQHTKQMSTNPYCPSYYPPPHQYYQQQQQQAPFQPSLDDLQRLNPAASSNQYSYPNLTPNQQHMWQHPQQAVQSQGAVQTSQGKDYPHRFNYTGHTHFHHTSMRHHAGSMQQTVSRARPDVLQHNQPPPPYPTNVPQPQKMHDNGRVQSQSHVSGHPLIRAPEPERFVENNVTYPIVSAANNYPAKHLLMSMASKAGTTTTASASSSFTENVHTRPATLPQKQRARQVDNTSVRTTTIPSNAQVLQNVPSASATKKKRSPRSSKSARVVAPASTFSPPIGQVADRTRDVMSEHFNPRNRKDNDLHIRIIRLFNRPISVLHSIWRGKDDWFLSVEELGISFFPSASFMELEYALPLFNVPCMRLSAYEENALCNYYGIPEGILRCKFIVSLRDFQTSYHDLNKLFRLLDVNGPKPKNISEKPNFESNSTEELSVVDAVVVPAARETSESAAPPSSKVATPAVSEKSDPILSGSRKRKPTQPQKVVVPSKCIKDVSNVISNDFGVDISNTGIEKVQLQDDNSNRYSPQKENMSQPVNTTNTSTLAGDNVIKPKVGKDASLYQENNVALTSDQSNNNFKTLKVPKDVSPCDNTETNLMKNIPTPIEHEAASDITLTADEDDDDELFGITISDVVSLRTSPLRNPIQYPSSLHVVSDLVVLE